MGLDMYLYKETYVRRWPHHRSDDMYRVEVTRGDKPCNIRLERITHVAEQVAYWYGAYAIHQWLVDHCQAGGMADPPVFVEREELRELANACQRVLDKPELAEHLMPTPPPNEYDDRYRENLQSTVQQLEAVLSEQDESSVVFLYEAL